jgi:hypothetical protein
MAPHRFAGNYKRVQGGAVASVGLGLGDRPLRVFDAYGPRRCYWGTDLTNTRFTQVTWRQRITHFTEELSFLSESDKDWIMGRGIMERLKWA